MLSSRRGGEASYNAVRWLRRGRIFSAVDEGGKGLGIDVPISGKSTTAHFTIATQARDVVAAVAVRAGDGTSGERDDRPPLPAALD